MAERNEAEIILTGKFEKGKEIIDATKQIDNNLQSIAKSSVGAEREASGLSSTLKKLGAIVGITVLVNGFKNLVTGSLQAAGSMEQVNVALTTMLGSGEKAAQLQKELIDFAKKTPFEIEGIFGATKQLLAYGFAQEEIISTMSTLGNIAAGVGVDMNRLALAFGQVKTTGKLMGQDLNQFTQAGVPLVAALANVLGKTEKEVLALKENGAISFEAVRAALESLTKEGGQFYNLMENQSKTFLGTISNMSDGFFQVKDALGQALLPVAKEVVNFLIIKLGELKDFIDNNRPAIQKLAQVVLDAFSLIGKAILVCISIVSAFVEGIKTILKIPLVKEILAFAAGLFVFNKGMTAATLAVRLFTTTAFGWVSVIIAVITAIGYLNQGIENMPNFLKIAVLTLGKWWEQLKLQVIDSIDKILSAISSLSNVPGFGWIKGLQDSFAATKDSILKNVEEINGAINQIKASEVTQPDQTVQDQPAAQTQEVTKKFTLEEDAKAAAKAEKERLDAAKANYEALIEAQKQYLGEYVLNQQNADSLEAENAMLKKQQLLLQDQEYADQKKEINTLLLNDEITADQYRTESAKIANKARLQLLQEAYDAEAQKLAENIAIQNSIKNELALAQDELEITQLTAKLERQAEVTDQANQKLLAVKIKKDDAEAVQTRKKGEWELKFEAFMNSEKMKAATQVANELVALQNSKNKTLAAIGKAAAIFQITVDTARGAMSAYQGMVTLIPGPVGMAMGAAAAAAIVAYGAEKIAMTKSASYAVGTDNIPMDHTAMVHKGEMIVPATFAEAIRSGDLSLSGAGSTTTTNNAQSQMSIIVSFDNANFYGNMSDKDIVYIGERLGELISINAAAPLPTRRA